MARKGKKGKGSKNAVDGWDSSTSEEGINSTAGAAPPQGRETSAARQRRRKKAEAAAAALAAVEDAAEEAARGEERDSARGHHKCSEVINLRDHYATNYSEFACVYSRVCVVWLSVSE